MVNEAFKLSEGILLLFNLNLFHIKTLPTQLAEWADVLPRLQKHHYGFFGSQLLETLSDSQSCLHLHLALGYGVACQGTSQ